MSRRQPKQRRRPEKTEKPAQRVIVRKRRRHPDPLRKPLAETHAFDWDPLYEDYDRYPERWDPQIQGEGPKSCACTKASP